MIKINREELAWAAGFFDGEGHVSHYAPRGGMQLQIKAIIGMLWVFLSEPKRNQAKKALLSSSTNGAKFNRNRNKVIR
jgi:hypothetical protein